MTTQILRSNARYYALEELKELTDAEEFPSRRERKIGRLLFRLSLRLRPSKIILSGTPGKYIEKIARIASLNIGPDTNNYNLYYYSGKVGDNSDWNEFAAQLDCQQEYVALIHICNSWRRRKAVSELLRDSVSQGMTFISRGNLCVITAFGYLPRQDFKLHFK